MEMLLLGIGMLYGLFVWKAWKKTSLDECRDKLFDIRDDARAYFLRRGIPLDDPVYQGLRKLINAQIHYTKRLTFPTFVAMTLAMKDSRELMAEVRREINQSLVTKDEELAAYIKKARSAASDALMQYIGETSAFILLVVFITWPAFFVGKVWRFAARWMEYQNRLMSSGARSFAELLLRGMITVFKTAPVVGFLIAMPARAGIVDKSMTGPTLLEEYAYEENFGA